MDGDEFKDGLRKFLRTPKNITGMELVLLCVVVFLLGVLAG